MTRGRARFLLQLLGVAAVTMSCAKPVIVDVNRFDTTVTVGLNGSLDVRETIAVSATASGAVITRVIAPAEADSVQLQATLLDASIQGGVAAGVTAENRGKRLIVVWHVPAGTTSGHELSIDYRVFAAIRVDEPRAYLTWKALGPKHGLNVASGRLTLDLPPGMPFYEGTGIAEAGWSVERRETGISATRPGLTPAESATILGEFDLRPTMTEGQWQVDEDRQRNLLPAYASAALFMLVIGIGTQWILRAQHPRRREHPLPDPERTSLARALRTTAWVGSLVAIGCAVFAYLFLPRLGPWIQLIPTGMILTAIMFVMFARGWDREGAGHK